MTLERWHVIRQQAGTEDRCFSIDQLIAYVEATLPAEERAELEEHLARCALCTEAVKGIAAFPDRQMVRTIFKSLNEQIRERVSTVEAPRRSWKTYYAIAAMLLLGLTSVLYLTRQAPSEALFAEAFQPYPSAIPLVRGEAAEGVLAQALAQYEAEDYAGALQLFQKTLAAEPDNTIAHFYAGIACLKLKNSLGAISHLQSVLQDKEHELAEPAMWYLALAYLQKNDLEQTKTLLNQIVLEQGAYEEKAARVLESVISVQ